MRAIDAAMPHPADAVTQNRRALADAACVVLDTDTTSWYSMRHRLVDIDAVCCRVDGQELTTFQRCIDLERPKPPDVHQVHGITDRVVQGQPPIEHVLPQFLESWALPDILLLANNARFDLSAIAEECAITIIYDRGSPRPGPRTMTLSVVVEFNSVAYVVTHCHHSGIKKTFRLDCIRKCRLEEEGRQSWPRSLKANALAHLVSSR
jgi:DNA polymerase III epsilon subunit-like protein